MKYRIMPAVAAIFLLGAVTGFSVCHVVKPTPLTEPVVSPTPTDDRAELTVDNVLIRFNEKRLAADLPQLPTNLQYNKVAEQRAKEVCAVNKVDHSGLREAVESGQLPSGSREVIAFGIPNSTTTVAEWIKSPTHRDFVLSDDIKEIGIGVYQDCTAIVGK